MVDLFNINKKQICIIAIILIGTIFVCGCISGQSKNTIQKPTIPPTDKINDDDLEWADEAECDDICRTWGGVVGDCGKWYSDDCYCCCERKGELLGVVC